MIKWARSVPAWRDLDRGYRNLVWPYHAIDEGDLHPSGRYQAQCGHPLMRSVTLHEQPPGVPCPQCALQLARGTPAHCGDRAQQRCDRPEGSRELLATALTRRQAVRRVMRLVLALAQEPPTLSTAQRRELRALAARVRPG